MSAGNPTGVTLPDGSGRGNADRVGKVVPDTQALAGGVQTLCIPSVHPDQGVDDANGATPGSCSGRPEIR